MTQFSTPLIRFAFVAVFSLTVPQGGIGAQITRSWGTAITIEGPIEPGDCQKIVDLLRKEGARIVFLASPGGSLSEAMAIGRLVRTLKLSTDVPGYMDTEVPEHADREHAKKIAKLYHVIDFDHNFMCASACFFIFIAGIERYNQGTHPLLGVHKPYLLDSELNNMSDDQALSYSKNIRQVVDSYLREMGVSHKYSDVMFSIPANKIRWISDDEFTNDLEGLIPELQEWVKVKIKSELAQAKKNLEENGKLPDYGVGKKIKDQGDTIYKDIIKQLSDQAASEVYIIDKLTDDAWAKAFAEFSFDRPTLCAVSK
jgi:hypothetical protein